MSTATTPESKTSMNHPSSMSDRDLVIAVSKGNPGALRVAVKMIHSGRRADVEKLAALGIVGPRVWIAYKDLGDQTYETLSANLEDGPALVAKLAALGYAPEVES